jgi:uncharacterized RDD family membrane protein YckC
MKCPSCSETLPAGSERCPGCGGIVGPPVQGALAPKPRTVTPPRREGVEPLRDIPGLRKKERTWRDEVQERVRKRRKRRAQASLPLFEQPGLEAAGSEPEKETASPEAATTPSEPVQQTPEPSAEARGPAPLDARSQDPADVGFEAPPLSDEELADLPLRGSEPPAGPSREPEVPAVQAHLPPDLDGEIEGLEEEEPDVSLTPPLPEQSPLERPARVGERAQAAFVDAGILVVLGALVLYFAGRAARADALSLAGSWPWLASYLGLLGLFYAGYFTGTTGQTPGKMMTGLRVVDAHGRPPGYLRSTARALVGAVGTVLAGVGLIPMALDPARRALHDRLLRTRVVHR